MNGIRLSKPVTPAYFSKCTVYEVEGKLDHRQMLNDAFSQNDDLTTADKALSPHSDSDVSESLYNPLAFPGADTVYHKGKPIKTDVYNPLVDRPPAGRQKVKALQQTIFAKYQSKDTLRVSIADHRRVRLAQVMRRHGSRSREPRPFGLGLHEPRPHGRGRSADRQATSTAAGSGHRPAAAPPPRTLVEPITPFAAGTLLTIGSDDAEYTVAQVIANAEQIANQAVLLVNASTSDHEMTDATVEKERDTSRSSSPHDDRSSSDEEPSAWNKRTFAGGRLYADAGSQQLEGDTLNAADESNLPPLSGDSDGPPPLDTSSGSDKEPCDEDVEAIANWRSKKQRTVARSTLSAEVTAEAAEYVAEYVARSLAPPPLPPPATSLSPAGEPQVEPACAGDLSMMD